VNEIAFLAAEVIVNLAHHSPDNPSGDALQMRDGRVYEASDPGLTAIIFKPNVYWACKSIKFRKIG
jgi:hypothetical protein